MTLKSALDKPSHLSVLVHKLLMELHDPSHPVRSGSQERRTEMPRAFFLPKAGARHDTHACCVEHFQRVELVGLAVRCLGGFDGLGGKGDGGEKVHCALEEFKISGGGVDGKRGMVGWFG